MYFKPRGWATPEGCAAHIGPTSLSFEEDHEENRTKGMKPTGRQAAELVLAPASQVSHHSRWSADGQLW